MSLSLSSSLSLPLPLSNQITTTPTMGMKFLVKKARGARVGALEIALLGNNNNNNIININTPNIVISTCKGLPHFISLDLLSSIPSSILQVSNLHFTSEGVSTNTISKLGGLHQMLGLNNKYVIVSVPRDSIQSIPQFKAATKFAPSFDTPSGRLLVKPKEYVEMISCMKPNIWAALADEVPAWVSHKRNKTSVDRTLKWLDDCLALNPETGSIFGAIVGGSNLEERRRCAEEVAKRNVSGYWIGGFGLGECMDERPTLLSAIMDVLPDDKPRMICGLGLPEEILQGIAAGIDLFDTTYIYTLTLGGFALTFPLDKNGNQQNFQPSQIESDSTKINLRATAYRNDTSPILEDCSCYTCKNHTKAYINHLLNVHEMLAQTLLEIHNTHHYLMFFQVIRDAIQDGRFEKFRQTFLESRRVPFEGEAISA
ncbi:hypothetical protein Lal_00018903 [Lupinus albus]|uniref:Queuine tRNA-ribosyltransferase accessory subunit 2 n=1 Tax=Lupinus albus TaxID=3870 RepID=A0A6A4P8V1_LUPAL|nr:putative tRNA-guanine(34) transglycosylase [Lupinus albus]KAF1863058.1 hypothetical protein Lal_00018903 [Lupinus albus]